MDVVRCRLAVALVAALAGMPVAGVAKPAAPAVSPVDHWQPLIDMAARRFGIPVAWIRAVMRAESGGHAMHDGRPITSPAGAMGLMQIMPATWAELRRRYHLGADPYDPRANILAGAAYLHELFVRFGYPDLFAAYHAGPSRFAADLANGTPLPAATRAYLAALSLPGFTPRHALLGATGRGLFFALKPIGAAGSRASLMPASTGLFVPLDRGPARRR